MLNKPEELAKKLNDIHALLREADELAKSVLNTMNPQTLPEFQSVSLQSATPAEQGLMISEHAKSLMTRLFLIDSVSRLKELEAVGLVGDWRSLSDAGNRLGAIKVIMTVPNKLFTLVDARNIVDTFRTIRF